jgi:hypothetical protein
MYQGSPVTGMQTTLHNTENLNYIANPSPVPDDRLASYDKNDQTEVQIAMPMPPGFAHGPLWYVDGSTGEPTKDCDGKMVYPYHRMLHNDQGSPNDPLRYTLWIAFEHPPEDVTVPLEMITEWPNANLQSTIEPFECGADAAATGTDAEATDSSATTETEESDDVTEESDDVTEDSTATETSADTATDSGSATKSVTAVGMGIVLIGLTGMFI